MVNHHNILMHGVINFDSVKYVKETLSCYGYASEMNFDPLARRRLFPGVSHMFTTKFDPLSNSSKKNFSPFWKWLRMHILNMVRSPSDA